MGQAESRRGRALASRQPHAASRIRTPIEGWTNHARYRSRRCASSNAVERLNTQDVATARESLRQREGIPRSRADGFIACWRRGENAASEPDATISAWTAAKTLEAAVWTNLPPKFDGIDGRVPTETEVVSYLRALEGEARAAAEKYVRRAPRQIATAYRRTIERVLGWTPVD
jgi:hypothetical protein